LNRRPGTHIIMDWSSMAKGAWLFDGFIVGKPESVTLKVEAVRCSIISWPTTSGVKIWKVWLICRVGRHLQGDGWVSGSRDAPCLEFPVSRGICHSWMCRRLKKKNTFRYVLECSVIVFGESPFNIKKLTLE
jgi:hypothetical protein